MKSHSLDQAVAAIKEHNNFLLSAHVSPEGDCVGSILALDGLLKKLNKNSYILCEDPIPESVGFLDNGCWHTLNDGIPDLQWDVACIADCGDLERIGKVKNVIQDKSLFIINLDHHVSNRFFGDINYVDSKAAASGEIIYELFKAFDCSLSIEDVNQIYVAMSTDTGSFKYSNTTAKTHKIVADLIDCGLDVGTLNEKIYDNVPKRRLNLFKKFINNIEILEEGKIACAYLSNKEIEGTGSTKADLEGFVEYMRSIQGVQISFLMTEFEGSSKVSFRAIGNNDVCEIAKNFGGGGHVKASGCTIKLLPMEAKKEILNFIKKTK